MCYNARYGSVGAHSPHPRSGGGGRPHRGVVFTPFQPNIRSLRLCGHGEDVPCRSRRACAGAQSGGERRVRHADGQGGLRPFARGNARGHAAQPHLHARRGDRGQRGRRGRLRTLSALRAAGEDPAGDQTHRRGRDVDGLRRDAPRSSLLRRQVPLLRRPRPASARRGEQYAALHALLHADADRAAGGERSHRAARGDGAGGAAHPHRGVRRARRRHLGARFRGTGTGAALPEGRSDHRGHQPHAGAHQCGYEAVSWHPARKQTAHRRRKAHLHAE